MYINFNMTKGLSFNQILLLQAISQNRTEDMSTLLESQLDTATGQYFLEQGYIMLVQGKKDDSPLKKMRLTKKGKEYLESIQIPNVIEGDLELLGYLTTIYLSSGEDRKIGNKKKIASYISIMRRELELTLHEFYYLCEYFLAEYEFTKVLEYIFFNSNKNRYGKFQDNLQDSPLYQFYEEHKEDIENYWKQKIKQ